MEIERIRLRSGADWRALTRRMRPTIVEHLFDGGTGIPRTRAALVERWGRVEIPVQRNYQRHSLEDGYLRPGRAQEAFAVSIASYFDIADQVEGFDFLVLEMPAPREVHEALPLPRWLVREAGADWFRQLYVGARDTLAPTHFDWDGQHVLLHHLCGRKRFVLFPSRLFPRLRLCMNFSTLAFWKLPPEAQARTIAALGGAETITGVLEPGETLYMPSFWIHSIESLEPSSSIGLRLGRHPGLEWITRALPQDGHLAAWLAESVVPLPRAAPLPDELGPIVEAYFGCHAGPLARYLAMRSALRSACDRFPWSAELALEGRFADLGEREVRRRGSIVRKAYDAPARFPWLDLSSPASRTRSAARHLRRARGSIPARSWELLLRAAASPPGRTN